MTTTERLRVERIIRELEQVQVAHYDLMLGTAASYQNFCHQDIKNGVQQALNEAKELQRETT